MLAVGGRVSSTVVASALRSSVRCVHELRTNLAESLSGFRFATPDAQKSHVVAYREGAVRVLVSNAQGGLQLPSAKGLRAELEKALRASTPRTLVSASAVRGVFSHGTDAAWYASQSNDVKRQYFDALQDASAFLQGYPWPTVAVSDGTADNAGASLFLLHGYRLASEHASLRVTNALEGRVPEAGLSYALSRLPGNVGFMLGLTGTRIGLTDMLYCRAASKAAASRVLVELFEDLSNSGPMYSEVANYVVASSAAMDTRDIGQPFIAANSSIIEYCFGAPTLAAVQKRLKECSSPLTKQWLEVMASAPQQALHVMFSALQYARRQGFAACVQTEFRVASRIDGGFGASVTLPSASDVFPLFEVSSSVESEYGVPTFMPPPKPSRSASESEHSEHQQQQPQQQPQQQQKQQKQQQRQQMQPKEARLRPKERPAHGKRQQPAA